VTAGPSLGNHSDAAFRTDPVSVLSEEVVCAFCDSERCRFDTTPSHCATPSSGEVVSCSCDCPVGMAGR